MLSSKYSKPNRLILIGASTGGPGHIQEILSRLDESFQATIVIAQHMGEEYIPSFVQQLDASIAPRVNPLGHQDELLAGQIYICVRTTRLNFHAGRLIAEQCSCSDSVHSYNPEINTLFTSAANLTSKHVPESISALNVLGIILTGIGDDGAEGCQTLLQNGVECIAESKKSAVVYGMPMQAVKMNPDVKALDLEQIIEKIKHFGMRPSQWI